MKTNRIISSFLVSVGASLLPTSHLSAQSVSYSGIGSVYTQSFDGLPETGSVTNLSKTTPTAIQGELGSTGVNGWYMLSDQGTGANTEFQAQNGSQSGSAGRGIVSFGTTGSSDRALGILSTSADIPTFGAYIQNNTASTLSQFMLSFTSEEWRAGDVGENDALTFRFAVVNSLSSATLGANAAGFSLSSSFNANSAFVPTAALNNAAVNGSTSAFQEAVSGIQNLTWAPGQFLILEWSGEDLSGQDNGLAINNLSFSAVPEPSYSTAVLGAAALIVAALWSRRTSRAAC
jgi:hypothetical protein